MAALALVGALLAACDARALSDSPARDPTSTIDPVYLATVEHSGVARIEPSVVHLDAGHLYRLKVVAYDAVGAIEVEFEIGFDPTCIQIADGLPDVPGVQVVGLWPVDDDRSVGNQVDNVAGVLRYREKHEWSEYDGYEPHTVAVVTVQAIAAGNCPLAFRSAQKLCYDGVTRSLPQLDGALIEIGTGQPSKGVWAPLGSFYFEVRSGDTLSAIALRFGTTVDTLATINNLTDADVLDAHQLLIIPPAD